MSDSRPPYHRRPTNRLPRAVLAPTAPAPDPIRDAETLVPCPCCEDHGGKGLVPATVRAAWLADAVVSERELAMVDGEEPDGAA